MRGLGRGGGAVAGWSYSWVGAGWELLPLTPWRRPAVMSVYLWPPCEALSDLGAVL